MQSVGCGGRCIQLMDIQQSSPQLLLLSSSNLLHLLPHPHVLVKRSKPINFSKLQAGQKYFHQRVQLFIELCAIFLGRQGVRQELFISRSIYLSYNNLLFMTYTNDQKYAPVMLTLSVGNVWGQIRQLFSFLFCCGEEGQRFGEDFEKKDLMVRMGGFLEEVEEHRKKSLPDEFEEMEASPEEEYAHIAKQLESSQMFLEYFLPNKISIAVLILPLLKEEEIMRGYLQYEKNHADFNWIENQSSNLIRQTINGQKRIVRDFFKRLSSEKYLLFKAFEEEEDQAKKIFACFKFETNFNQLEGGITSREQTSESSLDHLSEETSKEEFERIKRENKHFHNILKYKNQIDFTLRLDYAVLNQKIQNKERIIVKIEGLTKWPIGEYYYAHAKGVWDKFVNVWNEQEYELGQNMYDLRQYPLQVEIFFTKLVEENTGSKEQKLNNGRIGLRETVSYDLKSNTLQKIIFMIDKFYILFLIFQKLLSTIYKVSENIASIDEDLYEDMSESGYIDKIMRQFKEATSQYSHWAQELRPQVNKKRDYFDKM